MASWFGISIFLIGAVLYIYSMISLGLLGTVMNSIATFVWIICYFLEVPRNLAVGITFLPVILTALFFAIKRCKLSGERGATNGIRPKIESENKGVDACDL